MTFPIPLTSKMSGASIAQLRYWHKEHLLIPEIEHTSRPHLYSFRDVVALRTVVWLRGSHSLQQIRKSLEIVGDVDAAQHPSEYQLVKLGKGIGYVRKSDGAVMDLSGSAGQQILGNMADVFAEFETRGRKVDPLLNPRPQVEIDPDKLGGWPTIKGTRIPYDTIAQLIEDGTVPAAQAGRYYPGVTAHAASDALDYFHAVKAAS